jgi:hypothetical protein
VLGSFDGGSALPDPMTFAGALGWQDLGLGQPVKARDVLHLLRSDLHAKANDTNTYS